MNHLLYIRMKNDIMIISIADAKKEVKSIILDPTESKLSFKFVKRASASSLFFI